MIGSDEQFLDERAQQQYDEMQNDQDANFADYQQMMDEEEQTTIIPYISTGLNKTEITDLATGVVTNLLEKGDPLTIAEHLSAMEAFVKAVKADNRFTDYVIEEAAKHKGGFKSQSGAKIELAEVGTAYDFTNCNDTFLDYLYLKQKAVDAEVKEREAFLKTIPAKGLEVLDSNSGELITCYPPAKSSKSSFKITLAK